MMRNGERSYALGNVSEARLAGEEGTIAVEKFDADEIVITYKDADKEAKFTGQLVGNRIQGLVASNVLAGGKTVKLFGKWTALAVADSSESAQMSSHVPMVMNVCQTNDDNHASEKEDCFSWSWDPKSPVFAGNLMTLERFDAGGVVITGMSQHGTGGLASYSGKLNGNKIQGTVDYFSGDGHQWTGKWTASFDSPATLHK
jgi:hypothetical protein